MNSRADNTEERGKHAQQTTTPRAWEPPRLSYVGHVADILQSGLGKLSPTTADSGDPRKPPGQN